MAITIVGRSQAGIENVLTLLGNLNAYKEKNDKDLFFDPDQLGAAPDSFFEEGGFCKAEVECLENTSLNGGLLQDALFYEDMVPNPQKDVIYTSAEAAKEAIGAGNMVDDAIRSFSGKRQIKGLHPELGAFVNFCENQDDLTSEDNVFVPG